MSPFVQKWSGRLIVPFLAATILFFSIRAYNRKTDDFQAAHIIYDMPNRPEWEIPPLTLPEKHLFTLILQQPFYYLGKGAQCYAFVSEDGKYVLKFFKFKHLKPHWLVESLPSFPFLSDYKVRNRARKVRLIESVFSGHKLAYDRQREESGILFLHLNRTDQLHQRVILYDKIGRKLELDLDGVVFVVQERATLTRQVIEEALKKRDLDTVKQRLRQVLALYFSEYAKGVHDRDHGVLHNTGFVGDRAIRLDVGKLTADPEMKEEKHWLPDLEQMLHRFEMWVKGHYPQDENELVSFLEAEMSHVLGKPYSLQRH